MVDADADQVADVTLLSIQFVVFAARAQRLGLYWAALLADVAAAFHSTIRQVWIGHLHSDESVAALLRRFGPDAAVFPDLCAELIGPTEFQSAGVHHQLDALVAEMHTDTWTSFLHVAQVLATLKCTRPGDPFGSAFFKFVMNRVLRQQAVALRSEGLIERIAWNWIRSFFACDSPTSLVDILEITIVGDTV